MTKLLHRHSLPKSLRFIGWISGGGAVERSWAITGPAEPTSFLWQVPECSFAGLRRQSRGFRGQWLLSGILSHIAVPSGGHNLLMHSTHPPAEDLQVQQLFIPGLGAGPSMTRTASAARSPEVRSSSFPSVTRSELDAASCMQWFTLSQAKTTNHLKPGHLCLCPACAIVVPGSCADRALRSLRLCRNPLDTTPAA